MNAEAADKRHPYEEAQAKVWLSWTARGMQQHGQTVLLIEEIQPSWLQTGGQKWSYVIISRVLTGAVIGVIFATLIPSLLLPLLTSLSWDDFVVKVLSGLVTMPVFWGLMAGLVLAVLDYFRLKGRGIWSKLKRLPISVQFVINWLSTWIWVGLALVLIKIVTGVTLKLDFINQENWPAAILFVLVFGWITGRSTGRRFDNDIRTVETLGHAWPDAMLGAVPGAIGGFCFALFAANNPFVQEGGDHSRWSMFVVLTVIGGFVGAVFHGFRAKVKDQKAVPNQGVVLSFRHAVFYGGSIGVICGLMWGAGLLLDTGNVGLAAFGALLAAIGMGLTSAVWFGGLEVLRHYTLRLVLYINGYTPLLYAKFLDYAADQLIFMKKVGGGYMFIHRYMSEHFAEMEAPHGASGGKT